MENKNYCIGCKYHMFNKTTNGLELNYCRFSSNFNYSPDYVIKCSRKEEDVTTANQD